MESWWCFVVRGVRRGAVWFVVRWWPFRRWLLVWQVFVGEWSFGRWLIVCRVRKLSRRRLQRGGWLCCRYWVYCHWLWCRSWVVLSRRGGWRCLRGCGDRRRPGWVGGAAGVLLGLRGLLWVVVLRVWVDVSGRSGSCSVVWWKGEIRRVVVRVVVLLRVVLLRSPSRVWSTGGSV